MSEGEAKRRSVASKKAEYKTGGNGGASLGFEQKLWTAADKMASWRRQGAA